MRGSVYQDVPVTGAGNGRSDSDWNAANSGRRAGSDPGTVGSSGSSGGSSYQSSLDYVNAMSDYIDAFNVAQTNMVNEFNAKEAQKNRDWQERMARNAHQYEVEDLIKAGLNPVLSAGGQGAYVGNGAVASGQKAVADDTRAQAALTLLNNSLYSAGKVAAAVGAKSGSAEEADKAWSWNLNSVLKLAGIASSVFRTVVSGYNAYSNKAKALAYSAAAAYGSAAGRVATKGRYNR